MNEIKNIVIQFARLWGMYEAGGWSKEELDLAEKLKGYDNQEMSVVIEEWATEFLEEEYDDAVEFFKEKINNLK